MFSGKINENQLQEIFNITRVNVSISFNSACIGRYNAVHAFHYFHIDINMLLLAKQFLTRSPKSPTQHLALGLNADIIAAFGAVVEHDSTQPMDPIHATTTGRHIGDLAERGSLSGAH